MKLPADIRFVGLEPSDALAAAAREKAAKLDQFCPIIMSCRVTVELAHKHQRQGRPFSVRVNLTLPGRELTVNRTENEDPYVALRDAFDDMRRQLDDVNRRMQGQEKYHEEPPAAQTPEESAGTS